MNIRNYNDVRIAYMILQLDAEHGLRRKAHADGLKRKIRYFLREKERENACVSMVKDDGMDGYTYKQICPKWVFATKEDVEEYFRDTLYIESYNSPYDCTGRAFTAWYKIFDIGDNFVLYHRICYDV